MTILDIMYAGKFTFTEARRFIEKVIEREIDDAFKPITLSPLEHYKLSVVYEILSAQRGQHEQPTD